MKISDIGGEFELIKRLTRKTITDKNVIKGVGDDCAVIKYTKDKYLLITTDMLVEDVHFRTKWQSPYQIGKKLMECNVSDIVAMGGIPKYAFVSASISPTTTVRFMDELYRGINDSGKKHNTIILGGDTSKGEKYVLNICLLGEVKKDLVRYRSGAKVNDRICVTGTLGKSAAGLELLQKDKKGYTQGYKEPKARLAEEGEKIAKYAHAMIDVSDGLASEVKHICEESNTGALIEYENIPLSQDTKDAARRVDKNPYHYALYGGEDFEVVFTITKENIRRLKRKFKDFTVVGKIIPKKHGIHLIKDNKKVSISHGFDHFL